MSCPSLLGAAVSRVRTADTGTGETVKLKRGSGAGVADGAATPIIRRLIIHRNRGFVRTTERIHGYTPYAEDVPTGWQEQPSRPEGQPLPSRAQNAHKPKRNATNPKGGASTRRAGSGTRGPTAQVLGTKRPAVPDGSASQETGLAEGVQTSPDVNDV